MKLNKSQQRLEHLRLFCFFFLCEFDCRQEPNAKPVKYSFKCICLQNYKVEDRDGLSQSRGSVTVPSTEHKRFASAEMKLCFCSSQPACVTGLLCPSGLYSTIKPVSCFHSIGNKTPHHCCRIHLKMTHITQHKLI